MLDYLGSRYNVHGSQSSSLHRLLIQGELFLFDRGLVVRDVNCFEDFLLTLAEKIHRLGDLYHFGQNLVQNEINFF